MIYSPMGGRVALVSANGLTKAWVPLPAGEAAVYTAANSAPAYYQHPDHLGTAQLASTPGRSIWSDTFTAPFGEVGDPANTSSGAVGTSVNALSASVGSNPLDVSFTGMTADTDGGLRDFLFRRYSPVQGRWISPDPGGLGVVDPSNPQSWNRYAYVLNSPLGVIDPLGLDCVYVSGASASAIRGDCRSENDEGIYVNGTVTGLAFGSNGSLSIGYTPDSGEVTSLIIMHATDYFDSMAALTDGMDGQAYMQSQWTPFDGAENAVIPAVPNHPNGSSGSSSGQTRTRNCGGQALASFAGHAILDGLGAIPGESALSATIAGSKEAFGALQAGAGAVSLASSAADGDGIGSSIGITGTALAFVQKNAGLVKALGETIPIAGYFIAGASVIWDGYSAYKEYRTCMSGG